LCFAGFYPNKPFSVFFCSVLTSRSKHKCTGKCVISDFSEIGRICNGKYKLKEALDVIHIFLCVGL
jgi:hypothetical protein